MGQCPFLGHESNAFNDDFKLSGDGAVQMNVQDRSAQGVEGFVFHDLAFIHGEFVLFQQFLSDLLG
jgi:hypothetical protein